MLKKINKKLSARGGSASGWNIKLLPSSEERFVNRFFKKLDRQKYIYPSLKKTTVKVF